eukprot:gnl/TRDRNA2_/TRDRNA2_193752_c0_seq1.p1 gnl/TRDRNA2_/TRDRNA2_193752_c0~~gnl/TRDRNA2_/TRDRNA2_193752_c0_seq1.p1  ORF type:complete len:169 (-),score=32.36 gnl/TRDRNA2_/TRDRNA2_193752_c0_seq1:120-626(-)
MPLWALLTAKPRGLAKLAGAHLWTTTSFEDNGEDPDDPPESQGVWKKTETTMNLGSDAEVLPLCEDLPNNTKVDEGDSCWSTCHGQCPSDVLKPGVAFDFDEIGVGKPGCTSHFECVGNHDRVLCHGVRAVEAVAPIPLAAAAVLLPQQLPRIACSRVAAQRRLAAFL